MLALFISIATLSAEWNNLLKLLGFSLWKQQYHKHWYEKPPRAWARNHKSTIFSTLILTLSWEQRLRWLWEDVSCKLELGIMARKTQRLVEAYYVFLLQYYIVFKYK